MSVQESGIAFEFLYSTLSSDNTLTALAPGGVWRSMAPPSTNPPYVILSLQSGVDVLTSQIVRLMTQILYQVKVIGPVAMTAQLFSAAQEIDNLLARTSGTATGGVILACWRESPLQLDELVNGELWTNIGGLYRIQAQQTS